MPPIAFRARSAVASVSGTHGAKRFTSTFIPGDANIRAHVRASPYADAPRLPEGDRVRLQDLVTGSSYELEIGPGPKAGFLIERAIAAPEAGLVGLEIRRKWAAV